MSTTPVSDIRCPTAGAPPRSRADTSSTVPTARWSDARSDAPRGTGWSRSSRPPHPAGPTRRYPTTGRTAPNFQTRIRLESREHVLPVDIEGR
jgi:hypothetical protein